MYSKRGDRVRKKTEGGIQEKLGDAQLRTHIRDGRKANERFHTNWLRTKMRTIRDGHYQKTSDEKNGP